MCDCHRGCLCSVWFFLLWRASNTEDDAKSATSDPENITDLLWFVPGLKTLQLIASITLWRARTNTAGVDFTTHSCSPVDHRHPWGGLGRVERWLRSQVFDSESCISCFFYLFIYFEHSLPPLSWFPLLALQLDYTSCVPPVFSWSWCSSLSVPVLFASRYPPPSLSTWIKNRKEYLMIYFNISHVPRQNKHIDGPQMLLKCSLSNNNNKSEAFKNAIFQIPWEEWVTSRWFSDYWTCFSGADGGPGPGRAPWMIMRSSKRYLTLLLNVAETLLVLFWRVPLVGDGVTPVQIACFKSSLPHY